MGGGKRTIRKSFVDVGDVTLHLRTAGQGPAILLIHQAPVSGRTLEPRIAGLADDFFCLAPDLPGLGESDALTGGLVTVERMAEVFLSLLDRLGIERVAVYGQHTGALCATELALRAPERISAVLIGGYPIYTAEESAHRLTTYAPEFPPPSWDGGHLSWLWHRYREQFIYWPWNVKEPRARATCAIPAPEFLHEGVAEIAARHDTYAAVYHAAFDYDAEGALARVTRPVHFMLDVADSLSLKIELAAAANPNLKRWSGSASEIAAAEHRILSEATTGAPVCAENVLDGAASSRRRVIAWDDGAVGITVIAGEDEARPCLVLPPFPAGARSVAAEWQERPERTLILLDMLRLPSAGAHAAWLDGVAEAVRRALPPVAVDLIAGGSSAALAAVLKQRLGSSIAGVILLDPDARSDGTAFDATLCPSGGHLLRLWDRLRFERLKTPAGTPHDPASVRGRYESLEQLGRLGWHAVERMQDIPAWDRLVRDIADREMELLAAHGARVVITGIDRRGGFACGGYANAEPILLAGVANTSFRAAVSLLGREPSGSAKESTTTRRDARQR